MVRLFIILMVVLISSHHLPRRIGDGKCRRGKSHESINRLMKSFPMVSFYDHIEHMFEEETRGRINRPFAPCSRWLFRGRR